MSSLVSAGWWGDNDSDGDGMKDAVDDDDDNDGIPDHSKILWNSKFSYFIHFFY